LSSFTLISQSLYKFKIGWAANKRHHTPQEHNISEHGHGHNYHLRQKLTQQDAITNVFVRAAQTSALPLFCNRDLEINLTTLKPKGDLDSLKMYLHTENEAASLRDSKLGA